MRDKRVLCQKIVMTMIVIPFVCLFVSAHIIGCLHNDSKYSTERYNLKSMRKEAQRKADDSLKKIKTDKDIFKIVSFNSNKSSWSGSGFIVQYNKNQYLISASHVIHSSSYLDLYKNKELYEFKFDNILRLGDATIIKLNNQSFQNPFEVNMDFMKDIEQKLHTKEIIECESQGYTENGLRMTRGRVICALTRNNMPIIISSNPIVNGMSGGVLLDVSGKAVGVISAYVDGPEHWGMYLPISNLLKLVERPQEGLSSNKKKSQEN